MMVLVFLLRHQECHDAKRAGTRRLLSNFRRCLGCVRQFRSGRVSFRNAERLVKAAGATSSAAVESDSELLGLAASLTDDQFVRVAKRWSRAQQGDEGEALHLRLRRRRSLRFFEDDDGMTHLHGCFDPVTGTRIANRLRRVSKRAFNSDKRDAGLSSGFERRSFDQCMADALDVSTTGSGSAEHGCVLSPGGPAEISVVAHLNKESSRLVAEVVGGDPLPPSVLDELMCNSTLKGLLFSSKGVPLWQGYTKRSATTGQLKALKARDRGCIGCGATPTICQAHHIILNFTGLRVAGFVGGLFWWVAGLWVFSVGLVGVWWGCGFGRLVWFWRWSVRVIRGGVRFVGLARSWDRILRRFVSGFAASRSITVSCLVSRLRIVNG